MMLSLLRSLAGGTLGRRLYSSAHFEQRCGDHLVSNGMIRIKAAVCPFHSGAHVTPPNHREVNSRVLPEALVVRFPGRDSRLGNQIS